MTTNGEARAETVVLAQQKLKMHSETRESFERWLFD
jgi:hypothetical protein